MSQYLRFLGKIVGAKGLLLMAALPLPGCDSHYGVVREMTGDASIAHPCVRQALAKTGGVANIKQVAMDETESYQRRFYDYQHEDLNVRLSVVLSSSNVPKFAHVYHRKHSPPPQHEIDIVRPLMAEVERNLEVTCKLAGIAGNVKERCRGVHCPPLTLSGSQPNPPLQRDASPQSGSRP